MRYFARLSYDGSAFFGFQIQNHVHTVQSQLQDVISQIAGQKTKLVGAGRTDRGVHAFGQAFHFDAKLPISPEKLRQVLNAKLAPHVYIRELGIVPQSFHARYSAKKRVYIYNLFVGEDCPVYLQSFCGVWTRSLNFTQIQKAMRLLKGRHDFKAFCASGSDIKSSVRRMDEIKIKKWAVPVWPGATLKTKGQMWQFWFAADGFLYHMIRNIVGTLTEVGAGKISVAEFEKILKSKDRKLAGKTFHAAGLCLWDVKY